VNASPQVPALRFYGPFGAACTSCGHSPHDGACYHPLSDKWGTYPCLCPMYLEPPRRPSSVDADPLTVAAGGRIQARVVTWLCRWAAESLHDESRPLLERLEGARVCWQSCETVIDVLVRR